MLEHLFTRTLARPTTWASPTRLSRPCFFAPFAHLPAACLRIGIPWLNLAGVFALLVVGRCGPCAPRWTSELSCGGAWPSCCRCSLFDPVRQTFLLGQINILLALVIVADLTLDLPSLAASVGLAAAIKVTPIILIPYLFLTRQGRPGFRAIGSFCGGPCRTLAVPFTLHFVGLLDPLHPGPAAGRHAVLGGQSGRPGGDRARHRSHRHHPHDLSDRGERRRAGPARRRGGLPALVAGPRPAGGRGHRVAGQPLSWSHHFIWVVLLVAWLALAADRPRYGEWYALGVAVLLWVAPYWWVPHGPAVSFAGRGWLIPVSNAYVSCLVLVRGRRTRGSLVQRRPVRRAGGPWRRPAPAPDRRRVVPARARPPQPDRASGLADDEASRRPGRGAAPARIPHG